MSAAQFAILLRSLEGGGMQRNLLNLVRGFLRRGATCEVLVADDRGPARTALPAEVPVHRLTPSAGRAGVRALIGAVPELTPADQLALLFGPAPALLRALPQLIACLRALQPRALLAIGAQANLAALLARPHLAQPMRVVMSEHNVLSQVAALTRRRFRRLYPVFARALYPQADALVAVSRPIADDLATLTGIPRAQIRVIANPVEVEAVAAAARAPLPADFPAARPFLLAVGRLHWQKNYGLLLEAFARVAPALPALDLVFLGEGPARQQLQRQVERLGLEQRVHLRGFDPNPFAFMARARALVSTSTIEGFGHVLVEALACGCPVVAVDAPGGPADILDHGRFGRLVPPGDAEGLAASILATLAEPPDRDRLRARAHAFAAGPAVDAYLALLDGDPRRDAA